MITVSTNKMPITEFSGVWDVLSRVLWSLCIVPDWNSIYQLRIQTRGRPSAERSPVQGLSLLQSEFRATLELNDTLFKLKI